VITKCVNRPNCWIYVIRSGDNLYSIANWFGVPLQKILALNTWIGKDQVVQPGQKLTIPTPTR
jgi:LysM repeat protein